MRAISAADRLHTLGLPKAVDAAHEGYRGPVDRRG